MYCVRYSWIPDRWDYIRELVVQVWGWTWGVHLLKFLTIKKLKEESNRQTLQRGIGTRSKDNGKRNLDLAVVTWIVLSLSLSKALKRLVWESPKDKEEEDEPSWDV
ncbi:hypothetical protein CEXT_237121 [Caerostris extrusa]|uniref:Uncharacterized protein n=1 Tax=Caerostris extrusa TaxID=172846 RepID=A0AAV4U0Y8_CAEEX|nr:hypothetical protein CEXT_237121 [Caerostris extrusa]